MKISKKPELKYYHLCFLYAVISSQASIRSIDYINIEPITTWIIVKLVFMILVSFLCFAACIFNAAMSLKHD